MNLQMVFSPPTWPLLANIIVVRAVCLLSFVQNSFSCLIKDFWSSHSFLVFKPVISWRPFHYPTFRFFQLFGNFFNWQTSRSKYRRLGSQVAELFSINRVHLSWYSQNRGKILSNSGHKIRQIFGGKIQTRVHTFGGKMQKSNIPMKRWRKKFMILYQAEINNFCINDLFREYNCKLHYRLTK